MITKLKNVYYCEHCKKHGLNMRLMKYHEKVCSNNPKNDRPCFHCGNLIKKQIEIYGEYYDNSEWNRNVELLYCDTKKTFLYTPKNEIKGNQFDLGDEPNEPMPKECNLYNNQLPSDFFTFNNK